MVKIITTPDNTGKTTIDTNNWDACWNTLPEEYDAKSTALDILNSDVF